VVSQPKNSTSNTKGHLGHLFGPWPAEQCLLTGYGLQGWLSVSRPAASTSKIPGTRTLNGEGIEHNGDQQQGRRNTGQAMAPRFVVTGSKSGVERVLAYR